MIRRGFSLIEMIAALLSAIVLLAGLASTIAISTAVLESPLKEPERWRDFDTADRLAADLRYATEIRENVGHGFQITRPNPYGNADEAILYEAHDNGLTRLRSGGPTVVLDSSTPSYTFSSKSHFAPARPATVPVQRVRAVSASASSDAVTRLVIDTPAGCLPGDLLLLCVSARSPSEITLAETGWQTLWMDALDDLRLMIAFRTYDVTFPVSITITASSASALGAVCLAVEGVDAVFPIDWADTRGGRSVDLQPLDDPGPLETTGFRDEQLNVQVFAAWGAPWPDRSLGMASFTETAVAIAAPGNSTIANSVGVVVRNGSTPDLNTTPRVRFQSSGYWIQTGIRLEPAI
jgi:hypothetical protein